MAGGGAGGGCLKFAKRLKNLLAARRFVSAGEIGEASGEGTATLPGTYAGFPLIGYRAEGSISFSGTPTHASPVYPVFAGERIGNLVGGDSTVQSAGTTVSHTCSPALAAGVSYTVTLALTAENAASAYLGLDGEETLLYGGSGTAGTLTVTPEAATSVLLVRVTGDMTYSLAVTAEGETVGKYRLPFTVNDGEGNGGCTRTAVLDAPLRSVGEGYTDSLSAPEGKVTRKVRQFVFRAEHFRYQYETTFGKAYPCLYYNPLSERLNGTPWYFSHGPVRDISVITGNYPGICLHAFPYHAYYYWAVPQELLCGYAAAIDGEARQNALSLAGRVAAVPAAIGAGEDCLNSRTFGAGTVIPGLSMDNYYYPSKVTSWSCDGIGNSAAVSPVSPGSGYGLSIPVPALPGKNYRLSFSECSEFAVSFYSSAGAPISYLYAASGATELTFTTPALTAWICVILRPEVSEGIYRDIRLETAAMPDCPVPFQSTVPAGTYRVPKFGGGYWELTLTEPLYGLGDARDILSVNRHTGEYTVSRRNAVVTLSGDTEVSQSAGSVGGDNPCLLGAFLPSRAAGTPVLCTHFTGSVSGILDGSQVGFFVNPASGGSPENIGFSVPYSLLGTTASSGSEQNAAAMQTWLAAASPAVQVLYRRTGTVSTTGQANSVTTSDAPDLPEPGSGSLAYCTEVANVMAAQAFVEEEYDAGRPVTVWYVAGTEEEDASLPSLPACAPDTELTVGASGTPIGEITFRAYCAGEENE